MPCAIPHTHPPARAWPWALACLAGAALLLAWLQWLGRPWACQAGALCLWGSAGENSQRFGDAYSLLHVAFGMLVFLALDAATAARRPPRLALFSLGFLSLLVWEAIENMPTVIAVFAVPSGMASYGGDSMLNVAGDIQFGVAGFLAAWRVGPRASLATVAALDLATTLWVDDGLVLGTLRLVAGLL